MNIRSVFSSPDGDISLDQSDLERPLLLSPTVEHPFLNLKDYFSAMETFLLQEHRDTFLKVIGVHGGRNPLHGLPRELVIRSEKQGVFSHVASLEAKFEDRTRTACLSGAVTQEGKMNLEKEFNTLLSLKTSHPGCSIPEAYAKGEVLIDRGGQKETILFFLGKWFEDYYEWHLSRDVRGDQSLCIWDQRHGYRPASSQEYFTLFRLASMILTNLYDPLTSRRVGPWHHAAGDFVIGKQKGTIDVKLTTVRGYEPMMVFLEKNPKNQVMALLFFLLDMTLRMRLDRIDGMAELVWAEGNVVEAVVSGFFEALNAREQEFADSLMRLLRSFSQDELLAVFKSLTERYCRESQEEGAFIEKNLEAHARELRATIQKRPG